jgi:cytochrome oxidase assembly protein ShyY1
LKKWLNWIALVVVFAIACGFLANWQFSRREARLASITLVKANFDSSPVSIGQVIDRGRFNTPEDSWKPVEITGHYLPEKALLVRNRPNNGTGGFEELVPFVADSGEVIYVSRGWIPTGERQNYPDEVPLPSEQSTTIVARVVAEEPILDRGAPKGQLASINVTLANKQTGLSNALSGGYLRLASESPQVSAKLQPMPDPATEEGNNLSYAVQWIIFALMAIGALIWRVRRDRFIAAGNAPVKRKTRAQLDEAYEDARTEQ